MVEGKGGEVSITSLISDDGMVEGKGGESLNRELHFRWSHGGRQRGGKYK